MNETLYLCLDLAPRVGVLIKGMDPDITAPNLLKHAVANGQHFERNWQVFEKADEAKAYAEDHPTLVVIPIAAEVIPLAEVQ